MSPKNQLNFWILWHTWSCDHAWICRARELRSQINSFIVYIPRRTIQSRNFIYYQRNKFQNFFTEETDRFYWQRKIPAWTIKVWVSFNCFITPDCFRDSIKSWLNIKHCKLIRPFFHSVTNQTHYV